MKRKVLCYKCGKRFEVENNSLTPGERIPCPDCDDNCYFDEPLPEIEVETVVEVKE